MLAARNSTKPILLDPIAAEALIALYATEFNRDLGLQRIILEGNAMQVVNAVKAEDRKWSSFGQLMEDIRGVLNTLQDWKICHVKREVNGIAHILAKIAVQRVIDHAWIEETPICIVDNVLFEQNALP